MTTRQDLFNDQWMYLPGMEISYISPPEEEEWLDPSGSLENELRFRHSHLPTMYRSLLGHTSQARSSAPAIDINQLNVRITLVQQELSNCMELLRGLADVIDQSSDMRLTAIHSIGNGRTTHILNRPLFVSIEEDDNEVVASIPELRTSGFGSTDGEAIDDLKSILGELYQDLIETPAEQLGTLPLVWKRILTELVETNARASI